MPPLLPGYRPRLSRWERNATVTAGSRTGGNSLAGAAKKEIQTETLPMQASPALPLKRLETVQVDFFLDRHLGVGLGLGKFV